MKLLEKLPIADRLNIEGLKLAFADWEHLWKQLSSWAETYSGSIFAYGKAIGQGVVSAIVALAAMIFILLDKNHLLAQINMLLCAITPENVYKETLRIWRLADRMLSDFLLGKFADSVVIAAITAIVMAIFRMPLVALISVIVGITNMVPVAGPFIGGGIGGVIILLVSPKSLIPFLIMILAIQQLDGNIIGPKILGDRVGLPTIWTLFAIIVGGKLFGIVGMVLGVPIFAVIYTLVKEFVEKQLKKKGEIELLEQSGIQTLDDMLPEDTGSSETEQNMTSVQAEVVATEAVVTEAVTAEAVTTEAATPENESENTEDSLK
jgi:predicted PurR-regulated permease PerM